VAISESRLVLTPLDKTHDRATFTCGEVGLDRYIRFYAGQDKKRNLTACHILSDLSAPSRILGYFTLSSYSVDLGQLPDELITGIPGYPVVPAVLLGRLAIASDCQGDGLGELLLMRAFDYVLLYTTKIAARFLVVDALDEQATAFYQKYGFQPLPSRPLTLLLPIDTVQAAFSG